MRGILRLALVLVIATVSMVAMTCISCATETISPTTGIGNGEKPYVFDLPQYSSGSHKDNITKTGNDYKISGLTD